MTFHPIPLHSTPLRTHPLRSSSPITPFLGQPDLTCLPVSVSGLSNCQEEVTLPTYTSSGRCLAWVRRTHAVNFQGCVFQSGNCNLSAEPSDDGIFRALRAYPRRYFPCVKAVICVFGERRWIDDKAGMAGYMIYFRLRLWNLPCGTRSRGLASSGTFFWFWIEQCK